MKFIENDLLAEKLYHFDIGNLNHKQVKNLFQKIIDEDLIYLLPLSFQNAVDVYIRCGICKERV